MRMLTRKRCWKEISDCQIGRVASQPPKRDATARQNAQPRWETCASESFKCVSMPPHAQAKPAADHERPHLFHASEPHGIIQGINFFRCLVFADGLDAGKAQRQTAVMTTARLNGVKGDL